MSLTITGTITDSAGAVFSYSTIATQDVVTGTATVSPAVAPIGTTRTITVVGTSSAGLPLVYATPVAAGVTFTPVSAGVWSFVY